MGNYSDSKHELNVEREAQKSKITESLNLNTSCGAIVQYRIGLVHKSSNIHGFEHGLVVWGLVAKCSNKRSDFELCFGLGWSGSSSRIFTRRKNTVFARRLPCDFADTIHLSVRSVVYPG